MSCCWLNSNRNEKELKKVAQRPQHNYPAATPSPQCLCDRMQFVKYVNTSLKDPMREFIILPDAEGAPDYFSVTWKGDII